jgi:hypothetical protein
MPDPSPPLVRLNVEVTPAMHQRLKVRCAEDRTTVRDFVTAAIERALAAKPKKGGRRHA